MFEKPVHRGENEDKYVDIKWQGDIVTHSRFVYYGSKTRNEFRITRFGKNFPWLDDRHVGDLFILAQRSIEEYEAWILSSDGDIDEFLTFFNLSPDDTNKLIGKREENAGDQLFNLLKSFTNAQKVFPDTIAMAEQARICYDKAYKICDKQISTMPDDILIHWIDTEYSLFQMMEEKTYMPIIGKPFKDMLSFVEIANKVLNRRKSRAGKSLEHHLAAIFDASKVVYEEQVITEEKKRPDFIFPNGECYHNFNFPAHLLVSLAAKTTCKDRWRQVINEANRISEKHLFTLQQAISKDQLKEMSDEHIHLVVPQKYIKNYPREYRHQIFCLKDFIGFVQEKQKETPRKFFSMFQFN